MRDLPNSPDIRPLLYVQPETLKRLLASGRVRKLKDGTPVFSARDQAFPNAAVQLSLEVTGHAVHRRVLSGYDRSYIFEFVGDV